ncbi:heterokaryon incompatibility protein-domain-containing protein [Xylariales sp. PMI_506]|nr:heterokaryon incompatibility protein-domain-containing protein [Xylariales sp. PMI_506]
MMESLGQDAPAGIYQSLDQAASQIRLLEILHVPEDESKMLSCRLHVVSLDTKPRFAALSYVWGDASITRNILVNDTVMPVTTNLAGALRNVRQHLKLTGLHNDSISSSNADASDSCRFLWVDAVCINQSSVQERNSQVQLMARIYSTADMVLSWLGNDDDTRFALETVRLIAAEVRDVDHSDAVSLVGWMEKYPELCSASTSTEADSTNHEWGLNPIWERLRYLTKVSYFQRVWIFQEMVLARRVYFLGRDQTASWEELVRFVSWIGSCTKIYFLNPEWKPEFLDSTILEYITRRRGLRFSVLDLVEEFRMNDGANLSSSEARTDVLPILIVNEEFNATDPRDYIYGLLAISGGHGSGSQIQPDYTTSASGADVYKAWVVERLKYWDDCRYRENVDGPDQLAFITFAGKQYWDGDNTAAQSGGGVGSQETPPSWVPNFAGYRRQNTDSRLLCTTQEPFMAGRRAFDSATSTTDATRAHAAFMKETWNLCVSGIEVAEVTELGPLAQGIPRYYVGGAEYEDTPSLLAFMASSIRSCPIYLTGESTFQALLFLLAWPSSGTSTTQGVIAPSLYASPEQYVVSFLRYLLTGVPSDNPPARMILATLGFDTTSEDSFRRSLAALLHDGDSDRQNEPSSSLPPDISILDHSLRIPISSEYDALFSHGTLVVQACSEMRQRHRLVRTDKNYLALVPNITQNGDIICVLNESSVRVVLRKVQNQYLLIGECLVYGLIHNDEVTEFVKNNIEHLKTFVLQ